MKNYFAHCPSSLTALNMGNQTDMWTPRYQLGNKTIYKSIIKWAFLRYGLIKINKTILHFICFHKPLNVGALTKTTSIPETYIREKGQRIEAITINIQKIQTWNLNTGYNDCWRISNINSWHETGIDFCTWIVLRSVSPVTQISCAIWMFLNVSVQLPYWRW